MAEEDAFNSGVRDEPEASAPEKAETTAPEDTPQDSMDDKTVSDEPQGMPDDEPTPEEGGIEKDITPPPSKGGKGWVALLAIGIVILLLAPVFRMFIVPGMKVAPEDLESTTEYTGTVALGLLMVVKELT